MRSALVAGLVLIWVAGVAAADRFALVIGNGAYEAAGALPNPPRDAAALAGALEGLGFEVTLATDLSYDAMSVALRDFRRQSRDADQVLLFFAGHGLAPNGTSYVLPVDAQIGTPEDLEIEGISVDMLTAHVAHARELGLVILDACRDTPLLAQLSRDNPSRSLSRGLARATPRGGTLIAYATEAGDVAKDGVDGHSPYTRALLEALAEPGLEVGFLFRQVRDRVVAATNGRQRPDHYSALPAKRIYLNPPRGEPLAPVAAKPEVPPQPQPQPQPDAAALELIFWQSTEAGGTAADYQDYLSRFPNGTFASIARRRIAAAEAPAAAPAQSLALAPSRASPPVLPAGDWFVILGSYRYAEAGKAAARRDSLAQRGIAASIIDSSRYPNLSNGLYVVVTGPYDHATALGQLNQVRRYVPDAYVKTGR